VTSIIRVFPRRTSMTPTDAMAFVGDPPFWRPAAVEVHVSVAFTWDIPEAERLADAWGQYYPTVKIGGPALNSAAWDFQPRVYLKQGVTITSRGCNRKCPWCFVPGREGRIKLLPIEPGNIIQDNNILQTGHDHMSAVFEMLRQQPRAAVFAGGLDARLIDDWVAEQLSRLRIREVFLAADFDGMLPWLEKAVAKLDFLKRRQLRCYVLTGFEGTLQDNQRRLERVWEMGYMPFAQLYQPADGYVEYDLPWRWLARKWSRPAAMVAAHSMEPEA